MKQDQAGATSGLKSHYPSSLFSMIVRLWWHFGVRRRWQFALVVLLMLAASLAEILSLGMIVPFLALLAAPERALEHPFIASVASVVGVNKSADLLFWTVGAFCAASLVAGAVRLALLHVITRYSYALGADLAVELYSRALFQPYVVHTARNSSEVINAIVGKSALTIAGVIVPVLNLCSSIVLAAAILTALLAIDLWVALGAGVVLGTVYAVILAVTRRQLRSDSEIVARESTKVLRALQEGLGGIRDVIIDNTQHTYLKIFQAADRPMRLAQARTTVISGSPRFLVETAGIILIALVAVAVVSREGGAAGAIPVLGALALGAQRLLPVFQLAYGSIASMRATQASLMDTLMYLDQPAGDNVSDNGEPPISFLSTISLSEVSFTYDAQSPLVLKNVSLDIRRGARVGFMGPTGGGKSTLLDIVMGLLEPTRGSLLIDGRIVNGRNRRSWQARLAHVPQNIFLSDATVAENIAFGQDSAGIDMERVRSAALQAQIAGAVESWPLGYDTKVGERGLKLSGGQRQRIAVARALYKRADVIIFDEATSALDSETERALMEAIDSIGEGCTILIVAHRLSTLEKCDEIFELRDGAIVRRGNHAALIGS